METNQRNSNDTKLKAAIGVMALIIGVLGYLYFQERQTNTSKDLVINTKTRELVTTTTKLDSISNQLDAKIAEIKMLGGNVEELMKAKAQLETDKRSLQNQSSFNAKNYETKIKSYETLLAQKDTEIQKLREENQVLTSQNQNLNQENTGLKSEIQTTKQAFTDSVNTYSAKNKELAEKVTIAAALKAEAIKVTSISSKGKESEDDSYKAKKIDRIKVSFNLADNPLTKKENKDIYMRLLGPDGAVISDMATGSGAFMYQGNETIYTAKQKVFYSNTHQVVDFIYSRGAQYSKGKHTIELYSEGFFIGKGSLEVR